MIDIPAGLTILMLFGPVGDASFKRPVYDTAFSCAINLALAKPDMKRFYLEPARFECVQEGDKWTIKGKPKP